MNDLVRLMADAGVSKPELVRSMASVILQLDVNPAWIAAAEELSQSSDFDIIKIWQQVFGGN